MNNRDLAKTLIDQIPESKLVYIISYLQETITTDTVPNQETLQTFAELDNGGGSLCSGSTEELFTELMEEDEC